MGFDTVTNDNALLTQMGCSGLGIAKDMMKNLLDVEGTKLIIDGALDIAGVSPRQSIALVVKDLVRNNVRVPCKVKRFARREDDKYGKRATITETTATC